MKKQQPLRYIPFFVLSSLPLWILYRFADLGFLVLYFGLRYRLTTVRRNLRHSFPQKSEAAIRQIEVSFYRGFCDIWMEALRSLTMHPQEAKRRFRITNPELIERLYAERKHILLYAAHHGNWEWLAFLPLFFPYAVTSLYLPVSNTYFDGLMRAIRSRFGVACVPSDKGYKTIVQNIRSERPSISILIGDQCPRQDSLKCWTNFLNQKTAFIAGPDRIAKRCGQTVIFPAFQRVKRGHYEVTFIQLDASANSFVPEYAKALQQSIENAPPLWLWSHKRWKIKPLQEDAQISTRCAPASGKV